MKTKKLFALLLTVILSLSLVACSSGQNTQTPAADTDTTQETTAKSDSSYSDGVYEIGTDMPAGEYVLISDTDTYFEIASDSSGSDDSTIANDNFENRSIVTVEDGQYLEFDAGKAYPINEAPKVTISADGTLEEGMYKVGLDIPAGEYKIAVTSDSAYVEIASDSTQAYESIVSTTIIESGEEYITVEDGQYLKFSRAKLFVNK